MSVTPSWQVNAARFQQQQPRGGINTASYRARLKFRARANFQPRPPNRAQLQMSAKDAVNGNAAKKRAAAALSRAPSRVTAAPSPSPVMPKLTITTAAAAQPKLFRVIVSKADIFAAPSKKAEVVGDMTEGSLFEIVEECDGWVRLSEEFKDLAGWSPIKDDNERPLLKRALPPQSATLWRVVYNNVNVRDEPQKSARVLDVRRLNSLVEVSRREGGWVQLVEACGVSSGWMLISDDKGRLLEPFRPFAAAGFTPRSWAKMSQPPAGFLWRVVQCQASTGPQAHAKTRCHPKADAAEVDMRVGEGSLVEVSEQLGAWIRLRERSSKGEAAWMLTHHDKLGALVQRADPQPCEGLWRVISRPVNVRAAPNRGAKVLGRAYKGSYVHADMESSGWVRLVHRFGGEAAVEAWMLISSSEEGTLLMPCSSNRFSSDVS